VLAIVKAKLTADDFFIFSKECNAEVPFTVGGDHELTDGGGYSIDEQRERLRHQCSIQVAGYGFCHLS
jgi:hypothetical protein